MIDTWLFTALVLGVLALCVILRGVPPDVQDDRLVAGTVAVILVSMAALTLSIAYGNHHDSRLGHHYCPDRFCHHDMDRQASGG